MDNLASPLTVISLLYRMYILAFALAALAGVTYGDTSAAQHALKLLCVINGLLLLHVMFLRDEASQLSPFHKMFAFLLLILPLSHVAVELLTGASPAFAYPPHIRDSVIGEWIEWRAYLYSFAFVNLFLFFSLITRRPRARPDDNARLGAYQRWVFDDLVFSQYSVIFWVLLILAFLFATFSFLGKSPAVIAGGYGLDNEPNFAGINAWTAMSVIALVLSTGYIRRFSWSRVLALCIVVTYVVGLGALAFGRRAEIMGVALAAIALVCIYPLRLRTGLVVLGVTLGSYIGALLIGFARTYGIHEMGYDQISAMLSTLILPALEHSQRFLLPSFTDFYGTFPLVISYIDVADGELWYGKSYLYAAANLLPAIANPLRIDDSATTFLQNNYSMFNGGMYFIAELYMNFGAIGTLLTIPVIVLTLDAFARYFFYTRSAPRFMAGLAILSGYPRWLLFGTSAFTKYLFLILLFFLLITLLEAATSPGKRTLATVQPA